MPSSMLFPLYLSFLSKYLPTCVSTFLLPFFSFLSFLLSLLFLFSLAFSSILLLFPPLSSSFFSLLLFHQFFSSFLLSPPLSLLFLFLSLSPHLLSSFPFSLSSLLSSTFRLRLFSSKHGWRASNHVLFSTRLTDLSQS